MASRGVNKVILVGNLGNDPEQRTFPNGDAVANITLATSETWKDKTTGENRERTEWHRVVFHRRLAEIAGQYLRKGSKVFIEGRLQTRKWQDQGGQDRYTTEIVANEMQMLDSRSDGMAAQAAGGFAPPQTPAQQAPAAATNTGFAAPQSAPGAPAAQPFGGQTPQHSSPVPQHAQQQQPPAQPFGQPQHAPQQPQQQPQPAQSFDSFDDDIPF